MVFHAISLRQYALRRRQITGKYLSISFLYANEIKGLHFGITLAKYT
jgi:hypothetical protein